MDVPRRVKNLVFKYGTNNPFKLASYLNINVRYGDLPESVPGFISEHSDDGLLSSTTKLSDEWQRFVCAHELGHDRLHKGLGYYFIEEQTLFNPGKFERQANHFAVRLLTAGSDVESPETIESFYQRNDVPVEMVGKI